MKLPADEGIVEGVLTSSDECSTPIGSETEINQVFHSLRREEAQPVKRVLEFRDIRFRNSQLHKDFVLSLVVGVGRALKFSSCNFTGQTDR